jgi:hypothetical protein
MPATFIATFDPAKPGSAPHLAQADQRVATLIVYLTDGAEGSGTAFPTLGLELRPRVGVGAVLQQRRRARQHRPSNAARRAAGGQRS